MKRETPRASSERERPAASERASRPADYSRALADDRADERRSSIRAFDVEAYRTKIMIDKHDLDQCAVEQPAIFHEVSEALALAISKRDRIKLKLEQAVAHEDKRLRAHLLDGDKKPTDKAIAALVEESDEVSGMRGDMLAASSEVSRIQALKEAFDQRRDMIKVLAQLFTASYFTRTSASGAQARTDEKRAEQIRAETGPKRAEMVENLRRRRD